MQEVYKSSTAPEAHLVKIRLESRGIQSRIDGEHLQSGTGTLPAIDIVRVLVEDSDYIAASEVIDEWESDQRVESSNSDEGVNPKAFMGFVVGFALASGIFYWIYSSPVTVDGTDHNSDGVLDERWVYKNNLISKSTHDSNLDGKVDQIYRFGVKGLIKSGEIDYDFDGVFETEQRYHKGNVALEESDANQNGIIEYRVIYKYGFVDSVEIIDEETRKVRKRQYYENGRIVSAEFDSIGDGILDVNYEYDMYEEIK